MMFNPLSRRVFKLALLSIPFGIILMIVDIKQKVHGKKEALHWER